jgi:hypothetical protein
MHEGTDPTPTAASRAGAAVVNMLSTRESHFSLHFFRESGG